MVRQATKAEIDAAIEWHRNFNQKLRQDFHDAMIHNGYKLCEECDGEGELEYDHYVVDYEHGGYIDGRMDVCDVCEGEGYVKADIDEE